jgi:hypothetical protein
MNTKLIRDKIRSGEIKSWPDVYGYCSLKEMSEAFGRSVQHWKYVKDKPYELSLGDVFRIIEVLQITRGQFLELVGGED